MHADQPTPVDWIHRQAGDCEHHFQNEQMEIGVMDIEAL
jgi:hypothetical protein